MIGWLSHPRRRQQIVGTAFVDRPGDSLHWYALQRLFCDYPVTKQGHSHGRHQRQPYDIAAHQ